MVKGYCNKKENYVKMMTFFKTNFRDIILILLGCILVYLLVKAFSPIPDNSELLKYKIEQLDNKILETEKIQKQLNDSISVYKEDILRIDKNITDIKSQKTVVNNYYQQKQKEIFGFTNKQIDSTLKQRYNF